MDDNRGMTTAIDTDKALAVATEAVRRAGKILLDLSDTSLRVLSETGHDIKLEADRKSEDAILQFLAAEMPLPVLTEESGEHGIAEDTRAMWVVDPLDGTFNYARRLPLCCSCVGLWADGAPRVGAVYNFFTDELFTGIAGRGAWLNGRPIRASGIREVARAALATGFPTYADHSDKALRDFFERVKSFKKIRMIGTAALAGVFAACGRVDAYREKDIWLWDVAAAAAVAAGAGAKVSVRPGTVGKWSREVIFASSDEVFAALAD